MYNKTTDHNKLAIHIIANKPISGFIGVVKIQNIFNFINAKDLSN